MRRIRIAFALLVAAGFVAAAAAAFAQLKAPAGKGIVWGDFKGGTKYAQKNNRPMLIHFTTDWCGWCKKLEKEVYTVPEVADTMRKFVCVKVDGDKEKDVVQHYNVRGYPTIVFLNSKLEEVGRIPGYLPADKFLEQLKAALEKAGGGETTEKGK